VSGRQAPDRRRLPAVPTSPARPPARPRG